MEAITAVGDINMRRRAAGVDGVAYKERTKTPLTGNLLCRTIITFEKTKLRRGNQWVFLPVDWRDSRFFMAGNFVAPQ